MICEGACETQRRLQRGRPDFAPAGSCSLGPPRGHAAHTRMHAAALLRSSETEIVVHGEMMEVGTRRQQDLRVYGVDTKASTEVLPCVVAQ